METIPEGVSEESICEIDVCKDTPGFMPLSFLFAVIITVVGQIFLKKKLKN